MNSLKSLRTLARYNVLVPIGLLGAGLPAVALGADQTITSPVTTGVQIEANSGLTNNSAISNTPGNTAVWSAGAVTFLANGVGASIVGDGDSAIGIGDLVTSFSNSGTISNSGTGHDTVGLYGGVTSFTNNAGGVVKAPINGLQLASDADIRGRLARISAVSDVVDRVISDAGTNDIYDGRSLSQVINYFIPAAQALGASAPSPGRNLWWITLLPRVVSCRLKVCRPPVIAKNSRAGAVNTPRYRCTWRQALRKRWVNGMRSLHE